MDSEDIVRKFHQKKGPDPESGKNSSRIPDPGGKKAPDPDPQHWANLYFKSCGTIILFAAMLIKNIILTFIFYRYNVKIPEPYCLSL
jgi:hypothetical protein